MFGMLIISSAVSFYDKEKNIRAEKNIDRIRLFIFAVDCILLLLNILVLELSGKIVNTVILAIMFAYHFPAKKQVKNTEKDV